MLGHGGRLGIASALIYRKLLLCQIILNAFDDIGLGLCLYKAGTLFVHLIDLHAAVVDHLGADQKLIYCISDIGQHQRRIGFWIHVLKL